VLGGDSQAARLGDSDEIAKMPQLHACAHAHRICPPPYKVFFLAATRAQVTANETA
jgi:hypothetical protein